MKIINKIFFAFIVIIGLLPLVFIALLLISPLHHDIKLKQFAKQLSQITLPATDIIDTYSVCGKLSGCGNGMDFLACILVESDLSAAELDEQLSSISFKPAMKNNHMFHTDTTKSLISYEIIPITEEPIVSSFLEHGAIVFSKAHNADIGKPKYVITIYNGGYFAGFDIRGH